MRQSVCTLRKAVVALIAACSVVAAVFLVWQLVTRDRVGMLSNGHLLGILALFVLPGWTLAMWAWDRRAALRVVEIEDEAHAAVEPRPGAFTRHEERGRETRSGRHRHQTGVRAGVGR